jgi:hypothetical protein
VGTSIDQDQCQQEDKWGHFATHSLNEDGSWKNLTQQKKLSADLYCGSNATIIRFAQASKI